MTKLHPAKWLLALVFVLFFSCFSSTAQTPSWKWFEYNDVPTFDYMNGRGRIKTDANGNIYATGVFQDSITVAGTTIRDNTHQEYSFVVKFDSTGKVLWTKYFSSTTTSGVGVTFDDMDIAPNGDCYLTGSAAGTVNFDGNIVPFGSTNVIVLKLSPNGICQWVKTWINTLNQAGYGQCIVQKNNAVYSCGEMGSDSVGATHCGPYLVKLDTSGNQIWMKRYKATLDSGIGFCYGCSYFRNLSIDAQGRLYVCGFNFDGTLVVESDSIREKKQFISSFYSNGTYRFTKISNSTYYLKNFNGTDLVAGGMTFDSITIVGKKYYTNGYGNMVLLYYDSTLTNYGGLIMQGRGSDDLYNIDLDSYGNVIMLGFTPDTLHYDGFTFVPRKPGSSDIFLCSITPTNNNMNWLYTFGGTGSDYPSGLYVDKANNIFLSGEFESDTCNFGTFSIAKGGDHEMFMGELEYPSIATGVSAKARRSISVFPNPTDSRIYVNTGAYYKTDLKMLSIKNLLGQQVYSTTNFESSLSSIDVSTLPPGIYILELKTANDLSSIKFVKM